MLNVLIYLARIRQFRLTLGGLRLYFDVNTRIYLTKAFILSVIDLYDIIYRAAASTTLRYLDTAYNDLMRSILGYTRVQHVRIVDMYKLTSLEPLSDRANRALLKFMNQVELKRIHSDVQSLLKKVDHRYGTRLHNYFVTPVSHTKFGMQKVSTRGIKLLNSDMERK